MFSHIPEEIFCPQVSGNVNDALRVLKVTLEGPEKNAHFFDMELSLVDPENPVTQVSKTPSDEEFPWCGEDTDADAPSTTYDPEQVSRPAIEEELVMDNETDGLKDKNEQDNKNLEVLEEKDENVPEDTAHTLGENDRANKGDKDTQETKVEADSKIKDENALRKNNKIRTEDNEQGQKSEEPGPLEKVEEIREETEKIQDRLEVPNVDEIDKEQDALSEITPIEDPDREKKENEEKVMNGYKNLAFPKRPRSMIKSELLVKDVKKFIEDMKKQTAPEDLDVRIIPSNMACRFELPIDLTRLKGECPLSYLSKYCRVTDSRRTVYKEKFEQYKIEQTIKVSNLRKIYETLYRESGLCDEILHLQRLLGLDHTMELDVETFTVVSCLMERIMLKSQGRGPAQGYKKNIFEVTNFSALNGKLQGVEITPQMMNLLKYIRGT